MQITDRILVIISSSFHSDTREGLTAFFSRQSCYAILQRGTLKKIHFLVRNLSPLFRADGSGGDSEVMELEGN